MGEDVPETTLETIRLKLESILDKRLTGLARGLAEVKDSQTVLGTKQESLLADVELCKNALVELAKDVGRVEGMSGFSYWACKTMQEKGLIPPKGKDDPRHPKAFEYTGKPKSYWYGQDQERIAQRMEMASQRDLFQPSPLCNLGQGQPHSRKL